MKHEFKVGDTGKTRRGRPYRIIYDGDFGEFPLVALVLFHDHEKSLTFNRDGSLNGNSMHEWDLLPPTQKRTMWVNVYEDGKTYGHPTRRQADFNEGIASAKRISCVPVEFEFTPGEGL